VLLNAIRTLPECDVSELIQQIRRENTADLATVLESWRKNVTLPPKPLEQNSLEGDLSVLLGKPTLTQSGVSRHYGHSSGLSLVTEDEDYSLHKTTLPLRTRPENWTNVTQDMDFVRQLFDLYLEWCHRFYPVFSSECFLNDFESGRQKYCSPLLVNAICSMGCHFSDDPRARTNPDDARTAGDHFFAEARRLLAEDETTSLTTIQALCVMGIREPSAGRDSSGFAYMGRSLRMAIEIGLHLDSPSSAAALRLTPSEIEVRKLTFWGIFVLEKYALRVQLCS